VGPEIVGPEIVGPEIVVILTRLTMRAFITKAKRKLPLILSTHMILNMRSPVVPIKTFTATIAH
jgi:hypothetical protein